MNQAIAKYVFKQAPKNHPSFHADDNANMLKLRFFLNTINPTFDPSYFQSVKVIFSYNCPIYIIANNNIILSY